MRVWLFMVLGLAMLAIASARMVIDRSVGVDERTQCEATLRTDYAGEPAMLALLLPRCTERSMITVVESRHVGSDTQDAVETLAASARLRAQSALINLALTLAGIGALTAAWRQHARRRRRF